MAIGFTSYYEGRRHCILIRKFSLYQISSTINVYTANSIHWYKQTYLNSALKCRCYLIHTSTGHESQSRNINVTILFFNFGARWGFVINATYQLL
jgi:hypothetical protein